MSQTGIICKCTLSAHAASTEAERPEWRRDPFTFLSLNVSLVVRKGSPISFVSTSFHI